MSYLMHNLSLCECRVSHLCSELRSCTVPVMKYFSQVMYVVLMTVLDLDVAIVTTLLR